jgi:hypothetical protein
MTTPQNETFKPDNMGTPPIKIRELKKKDRTFIVSLIKKFVDKFGNDSITKIMVSDSEATASKDAVESDDQFKKIGVELVNLLLQTLEEDVTNWFIDLLGCTPEAFEDMPFDIELQIIQQIMEAKEVNRFFTLPSLLASKMPGLANRLSPGNTK